MIRVTVGWCEAGRSKRFRRRGFQSCTVVIIEVCASLVGIQKAHASLDCRQQSDSHSGDGPHETTEWHRPSGRAFRSIYCDGVDRHPKKKKRIRPTLVCNDEPPSDSPPKSGSIERKSRMMDERIDGSAHPSAYAPLRQPRDWNL